MTRLDIRRVPRIPLAPPSGTHPSGRAWIPLAPALAGLMLTACGSLAPVAPTPTPEPPPESWESAVSAIPGAETTGDWWREFDDPVLDRLIETALAGNQDLAAAGARLDAARAQARIAGADLSPQISASADGARRRQNFIGLPIPGAGPVLSSTSTTLGVSLNVSWEVDLWGRLRSARAAGVSRANASAADLAAAHLSVAAQTAKTWFAVAEAEGQLALARETVANRAASSERIQRRFERGLRTALDLRLARANEASARAAVATRQRQVDIARRQLQLLLGRYPARTLDVPASEPALPPLPPPPPTGLPSELLQRRPDLLAAEARLDAAGFDTRAARAALYPSLRLTGSAGTASSELEDLLDSDFSVWSLASSLLQPVFQGGRLRAAVELSDARRREAAHGYARQTLTAFAEVELALAATRYLDDLQEALDTAAEEATAAEKLANERYLAGLNDYLTVLEAQRQAFQAKSQQLEVERQRLANRVDLHLALGGSLRPSTLQASSTE